MAAYRRRSTTTYNTYGSVAYAPAYDGSAVRVPRRQEEVYQPAPRPRQRPQVRKRALVRTQAQVRQARLPPLPWWAFWQWRYLPLCSS